VNVRQLLEATGYWVVPFDHDVMVRAALTDLLHRQEAAERANQWNPLLHMNDHRSPYREEE
jgi:hypothetical protein